MLSDKPQKIDAKTWYYEELHGLIIIHEVYNDKDFIKTITIKLPWRSIMRSIKRKESGK